MTITPSVSAVIRTGSQGKLEGELTSSDTLGTCTIDIYGYETPVRFAWDEVSEEGEWVFEPEYFSVNSQSVQTLTLRHHRGGEDDNVWAPLDGHSVRFYVENVEYLDEEENLCVLTNTPTNPSDLSEWASFPDQAFVTDSDGVVSATLTIGDKPELESIGLAAYDFSVRKEPVQAMRFGALLAESGTEDPRSPYAGGPRGSTETITVDMVGREPDGEGGYREVPDGSEDEPGVLLVIDDDVADKTVIRVTDPGTDKGVMTLTWENPANNKRLTLTGPDGRTHVSGEVEIDCATAAWPMDFEAETVGREWEYEDKAKLTLKHDGSEQVDTLTLVVVKFEFVGSDKSPVGDEILTGGIEFTSKIPRVENATQDRFMYVIGAHAFPNVSAVKLLYPGGQMTIDFPDGFAELSKPILVVTEHYKESLLDGISEFYVLKAAEGDILSIRAIPNVGAVSDDLDSVSVNEIRIPISAKIVKGVSTGVGSTREEWEIDGLLDGVDDLNTIWAQFGYTFLILPTIRVLEVPDSYADRTFSNTPYISGTELQELSPVVNLAVSPPVSLNGHLFNWVRRVDDSAPNVDEVYSATALSAEFYSRGSDGILTLLEEIDCIASPFYENAVKISACRPSGSVYDPECQYAVRYTVELSDGTVYYSDCLNLHIDEFSSILRLDRNASTVNAYFVRDLGLIGCGLSWTPPGSDARPVGCSIDDAMTGIDFLRVTAHELGHVLGQADHVEGITRLMRDYPLGIDLRVDDEWQEYDNTFPHALGYDSE